jgi:hypothetical protein
MLEPVKLPQTVHMAWMVKKVWSLGWWNPEVSLSHKVQKKKKKQ